MTHLLQIFALLFAVSLVCSCASLTFWHFTGKNMVLSFWYRLVSNLPKAFANPLGTCVYCLNFWVNFMSNVGYHSLSDCSHSWIESVIFYVVQLSLSTVMVKAFVYHFYYDVEHE